MNLDPALVHNAAFRRLWWGQTISLTGDRALGLALGYAVYQGTGSLTATALLALAFYLPGLLFGSFAGVLADRVDRRTLLVLGQLLQGGAALLLLWPASLAATPWVAHAVVFAVLTFGLVTGPAGAALLPRLVGEAGLAPANAALAVGATAARLLGPALGGLLASAGTLQAVVLFDVCTFVLATALFWRLPASPPGARGGDAPAGAGATLLGEWRAGLRLIARLPALRGLFWVLGLTSLGGTLVDPAYMPFAQQSLRADAAAVGLLGTVAGAGTLLGGLVATRLVRHVDLRPLMAGGTLLVGALMLALYTRTALGAALVLGFVLGVPMVVANVAASTLVQLAAPDAYRGRVFGALGTTNALTGVLATGGVALAGAGLTPVTLLVAAGGLTVLAGLAAWWVPAPSPG